MRLTAPFTRPSRKETSHKGSFQSSYSDAASLAHYHPSTREAASMASYDRAGEGGELISAEALPEHSSLIDFRSFAEEYPEKLFPLLFKLRMEFQELLIEYYLLEKAQSFLAQVHGQIQTRIWQNLRVIEQAVGALIVLGTEPSRETLLPILVGKGIDKTPYGSLTDMILLYAQSQSYVVVAKSVMAPVPSIRKIFRPAMDILIASKNLREAAVGCYLRNLMHHASLRGSGLSRSYLSRIRRVKHRVFIAPPTDNSPLLSFGRVESLDGAPWCMFETSSEHRITQIMPVLRAHGTKMFKKKPAQIFAPIDADGNLAMGYIFARTASLTLTRSLTHVRGISAMSAVFDDQGSFVRPVTISNEEVQAMMKSRAVETPVEVKPGDFVEILTGETARYCGSVADVLEDSTVVVTVDFPTGRQFTVKADPTAVNLLQRVPQDRRAFWGIRI